MVDTTTLMLEPDLIHRARLGDRAAYGDLVCLYRLRVIDVVYRMCGDAILAEDAAQDAFIRAWYSLHNFKAGSSFRNWLYRIAVNAAIDSLRRERPQSDIDEMELAAPLERMEAQMEARERIRIVRRAVQALPTASRVVLILREYHGLTYQEISDVLEISKGTVMSRLNYARNRLAEQLSKCMEAT
jgi:RNA polymerase sigma-70 factor (ECF subfamily)